MAKQEDTLPGARDHHVEPALEVVHQCTVIRAAGITVDIGQEHPVELQTLHGLGIDDEDAALAEAMVALLLAGGIGDDARASLVQLDRLPTQRIEPAPTRLVVRGDDADQTRRIAIRGLEDPRNDLLEIPLTAWTVVDQHWRDRRRRLGGSSTQGLAGSLTQNARASLATG